MITELNELLAVLNLENSSAGNFKKEHLSYALKVTRALVNKMEKGNANDPLLLQFLPRIGEHRDKTNFSIDPLGEKNYSPLEGLLHKYRGRVLLLVTDECFVNCRFCFRRYCRTKVSDWDAVYNYIENDHTLEEVILSGGDPLALDVQQLNNIFDRLGNIPHLKRIRIHSRMPIAMPERITDRLRSKKLPLVLVIHCNHAHEIDHKVSRAIGRLRRVTGLTIFNQSVLLHRVNDQSSVLIALSEKLFSLGIVPYYLHLLDRVKGAEDFYVDLDRARKIHAEMRKNLSGYLVPRLVIEKKEGKILL